MLDVHDWIFTSKAIIRDPSNGPISSESRRIDSTDNRLRGELIGPCVFRQGLGRCRRLDVVRQVGERSGIIVFMLFGDMSGKMRDIGREKFAVSVWTSEVSGDMPSSDMLRQSSLGDEARTFAIPPMTSPQLLGMRLQLD